MKNNPKTKKGSSEPESEQFFHKATLNLQFRCDSTKQLQKIEIIQSGPKPNKYRNYSQQAGIKPSLKLKKLKLILLKLMKVKKELKILLLKKIRTLQKRMKIKSQIKSNLFILM